MRFVMGRSGYSCLVHFFLRLSLFGIITYCVKFQNCCANLAVLGSNVGEEARIKSNFTVIHVPNVPPLPKQLNSEWSFAHGVFGSHMVLQRNAPIRIWGYAPPAAATTTTQLNLGDNISASVRTFPTSSNNGTIIWQAELPPQPASVVPRDLKLTSGGVVVASLVDVLVGDVLLVSGQSNVGISVVYSNQFNASAEAENERAADHLGALVRIMAVPQGGAPVPQNELRIAAPCSLPSKQCGTLPWSRTNASNIQGYSALGWYLARRVLALTGAAVPVGIVQSDVPGTKIQQWTPRENIFHCTRVCGPDGSASPSGNCTRHSQLYNAMIHPFVASNFTFSAVVWYQGESNVGAPEPMEGAPYYACALPELVRAWRARLPTAPAKTLDLLLATTQSRLALNDPLPFFVVELAAYCNEQDEQTFRTFCDSNTSRLTVPDIHLPALRIAQQAALIQPNVYLVSAMDLGSLHPLPYESIHPVNKQEIARRIALAMNRKPDTPWEGPRPVVAHHVTTLTPSQQQPPLSSAVAANATVIIRFDLQHGAQGLALNDKAHCPTVVLNVYCRRAQTLGFEILPGTGKNSLTTTDDGAWEAPASARLTPDNRSVILLLGPRASSQGAARVRYAYSDWPVVSLRNAAGGLPARLFDIVVTPSTKRSQGARSTT